MEVHYSRRIDKYLFLSLILCAHEKDILKQSRSLFKHEKFEEVLKLLTKNNAITKKSEKLLILKTETLIKLKKYRMALETAIERVQIARRKSPWHCIAVSEIAIKLKDRDLAFEWLIKAVDRGFLNYGALEEETLSIFKKDSRFQKIVDKINLKKKGVRQERQEGKNAKVLRRLY